MDFRLKLKLKYRYHLISFWYFKVIWTVSIFRLVCPTQTYLSMVWELGSKKGYIKDHQQRPFFARIEYKMAKFYSCLFPFSAHLSSFQRRIWSIITKKSTFYTSFESSIKNWLKHFNQSVVTGWGIGTVTPTKLCRTGMTIPHPVLVQFI